MFWAVRAPSIFYVNNTLGEHAFVRKYFQGTYFHEIGISKIANFMEGIF